MKEERKGESFQEFRWRRILEIIRGQQRVDDFTFIGLFLRLVFIAWLMSKVFPPWMFDGDVPIAIWPGGLLLILSYIATEKLWRYLSR
jgi:hypothetical protein